MTRGGPMWDRMASVRRRRRLRSALWLTVAVLVVALLVTAGLWVKGMLPMLPVQPPSSMRSEVPTTGYVVSYVSDGDTIVVADASGIEHSVRLIGVNSPEVPHGQTPGECFGAEARDAARVLLPKGTPVVLLRDPALPEADQYGRRLAFVEVRSVDVGMALLRQGAAVVYELRSQPTPSRAAAYRTAEQSAQAAKAGLWGACPSPPARRS